MTPTVKLVHYPRRSPLFAELHVYNKAAKAYRVIPIADVVDGKAKAPKEWKANCREFLKCAYPGADL
jgi:hypothetical protein